MKPMSASKIRELATDIEIELERLGRLELAIAQVYQEVQNDPDRATIFHESLALKLHNFYTGCERIFQLIISELNGSLPSSFDWHKRLLNRMSIEREGFPAILTPDTVILLNEYLGFRHIVRNLYGFELDPNRLEKLVNNYPSVWHQVNFELREFINWLRQLAEQLE